MHFHGVHYPFGSDGSFIPGLLGRGGDVMPGKTFTYQLRAGTDSAGVWPYHDHSPSMMDSIAGGMYGGISILPRGRAARPTASSYVLRVDARSRRSTAAPSSATRRCCTRASATRAVGRPRARRRASHLPRPRPPLARPRRHLDRHEDGRPGGELLLPHQGGPAPGLALPLPRRAAHDARDDRPLPGPRDEARALAAACFALGAAPARAAGEHGRHAGQVLRAARDTLLVGDTVTWTNSDASATTSPRSAAPSRAGCWRRRRASRHVPAQRPYAYRCTIHPFMAGSLDVYAFPLRRPAGARRPARPAVLHGQRRAACRGDDRAAPARTALGAARRPSRSRPTDRSARGSSRRARRLPGGRGGRPEPAAPAAGRRAARHERAAAQRRPRRDPRHRPARPGRRPGGASALLARALPLAPGRPHARRPPLAGVVRRQPAAAATRPASCCCGARAATAPPSGRAATSAAARKQHAPRACRRITHHPMC